MATIIETKDDGVFYDEETGLKLGPGISVEIDPSSLGRRTRKWVNLGKLALRIVEMAEDSVNPQSNQDLVPPQSKPKKAKSDASD